MGVHKLFAYMFSSVPSISRPVSLEELADKYKRIFGYSPVLLVDGKSAVVHIIAKHSESKIHEMQWNDYVKMARSFVERMTAINIEMVFFFGEGYGYISIMAGGRRSLPVPRETRYITEAFESIRNGNNPQRVHLPPGIVACFRHILQYECHCTVICSLSNINREMARFAENTPNVFGIMTQDSNHLIFGNTPLLFSQDFDVNTFKTKMLERSQLLNASKLQPDQLSILAIAAGNDVITLEDLREFHHRLSPRYGNNDRRLINKIVEHIKSKKWICSSDYFPEIARELGITVELLEKGIRFYDILSSDDDDMEGNYSEGLIKLTEKHRHCRAPSTLYALLKFRMYTEGLTMEDPNENHMPPSAHIYRSIRQRMYHILFEKEPVVIEEWCVCRNQQPEKPEMVESIKFEIDDDIPSMTELLSEQVEITVRWDLFCACLGISIPTRELEMIEPRYVTLCTLLNFLLHCEHVDLEMFEVEAFICQALLLRTSHSIEEQVVDSRSVSLSGILWRGICNIACVVPVCGYPFPFEYIMPWNYFDGKVFYKCYNSMKKGLRSRHLFDYNAEDIAKYRQLYRIAINGTRLS